MGVIFFDHYVWLALIIETKQMDISSIEVNYLDHLPRYILYMSQFQNTLGASNEGILLT